MNNQEPIKGAVRLIKMMFLFNEQISKVLKRKGLESEQLPNFIAYNFGPFSKDVYEQIELFTGIGFVELTDIGKGFVEKELLDELTNEQREILEAFKRKITEMPIRQLLYYVYTNYPDYTEKSLIKDEVLDNGN